MVKRRVYVFMLRFVFKFFHTRQTAEKSDFRGALSVGDKSRRGIISLCVFVHSERQKKQQELSAEIMMCKNKASINDGVGEQ
jgi:hypothetical protein